MPNTDEQDYKDYQDYIAYLQYTGSKQPSVPTSAPSPVSIQDVLMGKAKLPALGSPELEQMNKATAQDALSAAAGAANIPLPQGIVNALKVAGKGVQGLFGKAAGLGSKETAAYAQNPQLVEQFTKNLQSGDKRAISDVIKNEIGAASEVMGKQAGDLGGQISEKLSGREIPNQANLQGISPEADAILSQYSPISGNLPADAAQKAKRVFQSEANYSPSQLMTDAVQAKKQQAGIAAKQLQTAIEQLPGVGSEVKALNQSIQPVISAQKAIVKGSKTPRSFISGDKNAEAIQAIDELTGSKLQDLGSQYSAAKAMSGEGSGDALQRFLLKPIGKAGVRATQSIGNVAAPAVEGINDSALRALLLGVNQNSR